MKNFDIQSGMEYSARPDKVGCFVLFLDHFLASRAQIIDSYTFSLLLFFPFFFTDVLGGKFFCYTQV